MRRPATALIAAVVLALSACGGQTEPGSAIPDLTGRYVDYAQGFLEGMGLRVVIQDSPESLAPTGVVVGTEPAAGTEVTAGDEVVLLVASLSQTIQGQLELRTKSVVLPPEGATIMTCHGRDEYADIQDGASLTVRDETGTVIGTGQLRNGRVGSGAGNRCLFDFTVSDLPDADFYSIGIANRDGTVFSRSELEADHWSIRVQLGDF